MTGVKTNEREGTRAVLRHSHLSAYKARTVLDLIRGKDVDEASSVLTFCERDAATVVGKVLASAVANARHNDHIEADDLYVASCFADEGMTIKRWRPRARGRATRIRKRTCHITVIVGRLPEDRLELRQSRAAAEVSARRARRVAGARRAEAGQPEPSPEAEEADEVEAEVEEDARAAEELDTAAESGGAEKSTAKKAAPQKTAPQKTAAKKAAAKKTVAGKSVAKKAGAAKTTAKKAARAAQADAPAESHDRASMPEKAVSPEGEGADEKPDEGKSS